MKSNIIIAGGGIIGLYSAYLLALRGNKPTLIDKGNFGRESSWAAGGILTPLMPWDYAENILFLTDYADSEYKQLATTLLDTVHQDIEYWKCGLTVLTSETAPIEKWCNDHEVHYKYLHDHRQHIHLTDVAQIRTPRLISALISQLEKLGVDLLANTDVTQCQIEHNRLSGVHTSRGFMPCTHLVWCTGAWAPQLNGQDVQIQSPEVVPIRGQMIAFQHCHSKLDSIIYKDGHYLIPRKDGLILAGSTIEKMGYDKSTTQSAKQSLLHKSIQLMPELVDAEVTHHWAGLRPHSKNNLPTIGPHPDIEGLIFNCGHYRYGIAMAPKSSQIVTSWICDNGESLNKQEIAFSKIN